MPPIYQIEPLPLLRVRPRTPVIQSIRTSKPRVGLGDTISLKGYFAGLDRDAFSLGGRSLSILSADSASVLLAGHTIDRSVCARPAQGELVARGAESRVPLPVTQQREGEIALAVGASRLLASGELGCLRTVPGSTYFLAFMDPRRVEASRTREQDYVPGADFSTVGRDLLPADRSSAPQGASSDRLPLASSGPRMLPHRIPGLHERGASRALNDLGSPSTPWVVGDTFRYRPMATQFDSVTLKVVQIYENYLVLAVPISQVDGWSGARLARHDSAMAFTLRETVVGCKSGQVSDADPDHGSPHRLHRVRTCSGNAEAQEKRARSHKRSSRTSFGRRSRSE